MSVINQNITDEALRTRENWEHAAPNAYQQQDLQVLDMIEEIRRLRGWLYIVINAGDTLPQIRPVQEDAAKHLGVERTAAGLQEVIR